MPGQAMKPKHTESCESKRACGGGFSQCQAGQA